MAQEIQEVPTVGRKALRWMAATCVVLLVAVLVVGQMYFSEQDKRLARERELRDLWLQREMDLAAGRAGPAIDRAVLPRRTVNWNGQERTVIVVGQQRAEQLGLESGDVVLVQTRPAPTTSQAAP